MRVSQSELADRDLMLAKKLVEGVTIEGVARLYGLSVGTVSQTKRRLITSGVLIHGRRKNQVEFADSPSTDEGDRLEQVHEGGKRVIRFGPDWKPERAQSCYTFGSVGSSLNSNVAAPD